MLIANPAMLGLGAAVSSPQQNQTPFLMLFFALMTGLGGALMTILLKYLAASFLPCYNLLSFGTFVTIYSLLLIFFTQGKLKPDGTYGF